MELPHSLKQITNLQHCLEGDLQILRFAPDLSSISSCVQRLDRIVVVMVRLLSLHTRAVESFNHISAKFIN